MKILLRLRLAEGALVWVDTRLCLIPGLLVVLRLEKAAREVLLTTRTRRLARMMLLLAGRMSVAPSGRDLAAGLDREALEVEAEGKGLHLVDQATHLVDQATRLVMSGVVDRHLELERHTRTYLARGLALGLVLAARCLEALVLAVRMDTSGGLD